MTTGPVLLSVLTTEADATTSYDPMAVPATPSVPVLDPGSDTGRSDSDRITNDTTPTLTGTGPANTLIRVYERDVVVATGTSDSSGAWSITLPTQNYGQHRYHAVAVDSEGVESAFVGFGTRTISSRVTTTGFNADVAVLTSGVSVIVYQVGRDFFDPKDVFARLYAPDGTPIGAEFRINSETAGAQYDPAVTPLANGGFLVTWTSSGAIHADISARLFDATGTAVGEDFTVNTYLTEVQAYPSVAGLTDGGFVVTWQSFGQNNAHFDVYAQRYDATGALVGPETLVNARTALRQESPSVAALSDGGYVIVFTDEGGDPSQTAVTGQRYNAVGEAVGSAFRVNTFTTDYQEAATVVGLPGGGFVVVWETIRDGWGVDIVGQRFNAAGQKVGAEFQVNPTGNMSNQTIGDIAALSTGGFVVS